MENIFGENGVSFLLSNNIFLKNLFCKKTHSFFFKLCKLEVEKIWFGIHVFSLAKTELSFGWKTISRLKANDWEKSANVQRLKILKNADISNAQTHGFVYISFLFCVTQGKVQQRPVTFTTLLDYVNITFFTWVNILAIHIKAFNSIGVTYSETQEQLVGTSQYFRETRYFGGKVYFTWKAEDPKLSRRHDQLPLGLRGCTRPKFVHLMST